MNDMILFLDGSTPVSELTVFKTSTGLSCIVAALQFNLNAPKTQLKLWLTYLSA